MAIWFCKNCMFLKNRFKLKAMLTTNQIAGTLYLKNILRYNVQFLHLVRYPWQLYSNCVIFAWFGQACLCMSTVLQNKATISMSRLELSCLFVACSYTSMEAIVLSCGWVWSVMPKVLWNNKSPISLEEFVWFCWFFASSY